MEINKVSSVENQNFTSNTKAKEKQTKTTEQIENGKKKLFLAAVGIAAVAVAGIAIATKIKSRKPVNVKLNDISFFNGKASLNGKNFTGVINDKLKNGDDIVLEYVDGVIKKSTRSGSKNLTKTFNYNQDGTVKSIQTKFGDTITDFIKTKKGHVIKENGTITKGFSEYKDGCIVADFKNGKPIESKKYSGNTPIEMKKYSYDENGKLSQLEIFERNNRVDFSDRPDLKTKYTPNGSSITTKKDGYYGNEETVIRVIKTKKDGVLNYNADVSVYKGDNYGNKTEYFKDGEKIIEETERYGSIYGNYGHPQAVGLQTNIDTNAPLRYIDVLDKKTGEITHKRIYNNGAYDIDKSSSPFQTGSKIEHFDSNGKTTGFSEIEKISKHDSSDRYTERTETQYIEHVFDANHKPLSSKNGTYSESCHRFSYDD